MHARIEHLLSLRDGEPVGAELVAHVRSCPICTGELQRLSALRAEMQGLPQFEPRKLPPRRVGIAAAAAALITLAAIALIARYGDQQSSERSAHTPKVLNKPASSDGTHLDELVAQSQQLEQILQTLPQRPRIERVSTAATIDTIEQRIAWLDFQLSSVSDDGDLSEEQSRRLWRERVELMDSLVKVRYAEAGSLWF
jgi:hypothetical protein